MTGRFQGHYTNYTLFERDWKTSADGTFYPEYAIHWWDQPQKSARVRDFKNRCNRNRRRYFDRLIHEWQTIEDEEERSYESVSDVSEDTFGDKWELY